MRRKVRDATACSTDGRNTCIKSFSCPATALSFACEGAKMVRMTLVFYSGLPPGISLIVFRKEFRLDQKPSFDQSAHSVQLVLSGNTPQQ